MRQLEDILPFVLDNELHDIALHELTTLQFFSWELSVGLLNISDKGSHVTQRRKLLFLVEGGRVCREERQIIDVVEQFANS